MWDVATGAPLTSPFGSAFLRFNDTAFHPDGTRLATAEWSVARLWDAKTGVSLGNPLHHEGNDVLAVAFSPDGTRLATAGTGWRLDQAWVWDVATGARIGNSLRHKGGIYSTAFSPDGTRLATGGNEGNVLLWDVNIAAVLHRHALVEAICDCEVTHPDNPLTDAAANPICSSWSSRTITREDVEAFPILRGREGENVCSKNTTWREVYRLFANIFKGE